MDNKETQILYKKDLELEQNDIKGSLASVYAALKEKGYNPVNQIVGYIMSGDPNYITSFKNARNVMTKIERDEILEELVSHYFETNFKI